MGFTGDGDDVGALLLDDPKRLGGPGDRLVDDDGLHLRIVGKAGDDADGRLLLIHEVVRIRYVLENTTTCNRTILGDQALCSSQVILGL
ncbi:MAG: hypothetical protein BWY50_02174 [Spirochaetes bacterium ADurb.Bin315]|nr:MAG: hypothetical protein BWY50_02174 [Spirochaetes bacterium ADurb.Bin315]